MAAIAGICVIFGVFPMPVAIAFIVFAGGMLLLRRDPRFRRTPDTPSFGCLCAVLGFPVGAVIGFQLASLAVGRMTRVGDYLAFGAAIGGFLGALAAAAAGHYLSLALFRPLLTGPKPPKTQRDALRENIEVVDGLIKLARQERDEEVGLKLSDYKTKLEQELELLPSETLE
jgi:hypothetical protein